MALLTPAQTAQMLPLAYQGDMRAIGRLLSGLTAGEIGANAGQSLTSGIFVQSTGDDDWPGTRFDRPKKTIASASAAASALVAAGAPACIIDVVDASNYTEDVSLTAGVRLHGPAATVSGEVELTTFTEVELATIQGTGDNQTLLSMTTGDNGYAIARVGMINAAGLVGCNNVRNVGGANRTLHVHAGIVNVGEDGIGIGDVTPGVGHLHITLGDLYLIGDNAVGILGSASEGDGANIVGWIDHIISIVGTGTVGIKMDAAEARVKLGAAEILADINVSAGELYMNCLRVVGTETHTGGTIVRPTLSTTTI